MQRYDTTFTSFATLTTNIKYHVLGEGLYSQGGKKYKEAYVIVSIALDRLEQNWVDALLLHI